MKGKIQTTGLLLALALIFSYVESLLPLPFGIPGMKLGLPNLMTVLLLYRYGAGEALCVNLLRVVTAGFLFGGMSAILFSLAGALLSFAGMAFFKRTNLLGIEGVSMAGGILHNLGQLAVAFLMTGTVQVLSFLAPLLAAGCVTGLAIGALAKRLLPYLYHIS